MPGIIRCPGCGQEIDANSRFCSHCTTRICPGCHGPVPPRAIYCPHCGFSVGPAVPGASEQPAPTPSPRPFTQASGGITGPQPRQFPAASGGIIGPQPGQPPYYNEPQGPISGTPIPQAMPPQQYGAGNQQPFGAAEGMPYASAQAPISPGKTFKDTGPIRVRRGFPPALILLLIIAVIGLGGFAIYQTGWLQGPIDKARELISGINLPDWLPFGNEDTVPPVVVNASASNVSNAGAVIIWQTDEPSTSQVMICESTGGCTWTELDENLVTDHSVNITDLKPNTQYHFTATSTDTASNQGTGEGDFTTLGASVTPTLVISGITVSGVTEVAVTISWTTDKPGTTQVTYGTTSVYGSTTALEPALGTSHSVSLAGLTAATTYHFKVMSKDSSGNEVVSPDQTFTTNSAIPQSTEVGPEVGMRAPDFTLPTLDGKQVSLSDFRGKVVIINFWQNVQQSRNELALMQDAYVSLPRDTVTMLAISWKQTPAITESVATSKGLTMPVLLDESGDVAAKYNITISPVTIFVDGQGTVRDTSLYPATLKSVLQIESIVNSIQ